MGVDTSNFVQEWIVVARVHNKKEEIVSFDVCKVLEDTNIDKANQQ